MKKLIIIIVLAVGIIFLLIPENQPVNEDLNINVASHLISIENNDLNVSVDEKGVSKEQKEVLKSYGIDIYYGKSGIDTAKYDVVIYNDKEDMDYEISGETLIINSLFFKEYPLVYSFSIKDGINDLMVTPYVEYDGEFIKVSELSADNYDYSQQTEIYEQINGNISNLSYIAKEQYEQITYLDKIDSLSVVNKNTCMTNEQENLTSPNVRLSKYTTSEVHLISSEISQDVENLFDDLSSKGIEVVFDSGYRSFAIQSPLYDSYVANDGVVAADTYSARPGCSEHQTGYAFDINTVENEFGDLENLNGSKIAEDIEKTAIEHGFILRYPMDKTNITQYTYESWHFRYVGKDASKIIYDNNITLEEYVNNKSYYDSRVSIK